MNAEQTVTVVAVGGLVVVLGLLQALLPTISRPGIWFAVTVPVDFRGSQQARSALNRYRGGVAFHAGVALAFVAAGTGLSRPVLLVLGLLWQIVGSTVAFLLARRKSLPFAVPQEARREASLTPPSTSFPGGPLLQIGPFAVLAVLAVWLATHWTSIPDRFPVHFGLDGRPNGWASKSFGSVFGLILTAAVVCLAQAAGGIGLLKGSRRISAKGMPAHTEARFRRATLSVLLGGEYLVALVFTMITLRMTGVWQAPMLITTVSAFAFVLVTATVLIRLGQGGARAAGSESAPTDLTPDASWKWGIFYFNKNDPAVMVEKRFGLGYTLNFGTKRAWLLLGIILALSLATPLLLALTK